MTYHTHITYVEGCYRCDLSRDEIADLLWVEDCIRKGLAIRVQNYRDGRTTLKTLFRMRRQMKGIND